eukprot:1448658-Prymnesium_polylepis.1
MATQPSDVILLLGQYLSAKRLTRTGKGRPRRREASCSSTILCACRAARARAADVRRIEPWRLERLAASGCV